MKSTELKSYWDAYVDNNTKNGKLENSTVKNMFNFVDYVNDIIMDLIQSHYVDFNKKTIDVKDEFLIKYLARIHFEEIKHKVLSLNTCNPENKYKK